MWEFVEEIGRGAWWSLVTGAVGVLSLLIQVFVLRHVRRIQERVYSQTRVPALLRDLKGFSGELARLLGSFAANRDSIRETMSKCRPTVDSLANKLAGRERRAATDLLHEIDVYRGRRRVLGIAVRTRPLEIEVQCRHVYEAMLALQESVRHRQEDIRRSVTYER